MPRFSDIAGARFYTERTHHIASYRVYDYRITHPDGTVSRHMERLGESISYYKIDPAAAGQFDRFLDTVCYLP